jgi:hypothetical protein
MPLQSVTMRVSIDEQRLLLAIRGLLQMERAESEIVDRLRNLLLADLDSPNGKRLQGLGIFKWGGEKTGKGGAK